MLSLFPFATLLLLCVGGGAEGGVISSQHVRLDHSGIAHQERAASLLERECIVHLRQVAVQGGVSRFGAC
jgi:hypothetical protein